MSSKNMTSRQRVAAALEHREPDRIPRDLGGSNYTTIHVDAHSNLKRYLGLQGGADGVFSLLSQTAVVDKRIQERFGIDFAPLGTKPPSTWNLKIVTDEKGYRKYADEWGVVRACPPGGYYYDVVENPLANATLSNLDRYPWPDPMDLGRFTGLAESGKDLYEKTDKCIVLATGANLFSHSAFLLGYERFLLSLAADPLLVKAIVEQKVGFSCKLLSEALDRVGKYVQVAILSDDLTHQRGLFISQKMIQEIFLPGYREIIKTIKSKSDIKIFFHICGASHLVFEDLISVGVDAVHPVQVSAAGMEDTAALKEKYGKRLTFWGGGCDTQRVLPYGTPEEVRAETRRRIADLAPGGGFVFCAVHNIQRDVPPENIVAMYEEAIKWERYQIGKGR